MAKPIELIPLVCPKCSTPIPAGPDEVAWVCGMCGQGVVLDEQQGARPLDISFSQLIPVNGRGKPFWVTQGKVTLKRDTYSGDKDRESQAFWAAPHQFTVPAFACNLDTLLDLGVSLLRTPPALQPGAPAAFDPVVMLPDDVRPAAEFLVMAVEAARSDKLKEVQFQLDLSDPVLWVLP